jgi:tRNA pseudouridine38-40 synthase
LIYPRKNPHLYHKGYYYPYPLDFEALGQAASLLTKYTDFESFCKRNGQQHTFICQIMMSEWKRSARGLEYIVVANRFLRGMVRGLVATQLMVGSGAISLNEFRNIIEAKDCTKARFTAPGFGLYLEHIAYKQGALRLMHTPE